MPEKFANPQPPATPNCQEEDLLASKAGHGDLSTLKTGSPSEHHSWYFSIDEHHGAADAPGEGDPVSTRPFAFEVVSGLRAESPKAPAWLAAKRLPSTVVTFMVCLVVSLPVVNAACHDTLPPALTILNVVTSEAEGSLAIDSEDDHAYHHATKFDGMKIDMWEYETTQWTSPELLGDDTNAKTEFFNKKFNKIRMTIALDTTTLGSTPVCLSSPVMLAMMINATADNTSALSLSPISPAMALDPAAGTVVTAVLNATTASLSPPISPAISVSTSAGAAPANTTSSSRISPAMTIDILAGVLVTTAPDGITPVASAPISPAMWINAFDGAVVTTYHST
jgi:hypothetical protein